MKTSKSKYVTSFTEKGGKEIKAPDVGTKSES
jgi:hypothetical protein